nr:hypothetical protein [Propionicimonas sp.]
MGGGSSRWPVSAGLLAAAAGLAGAALVLYWRPCAANMLTGSALNGYRLQPEFTEACLETMDGAPGFPLPEAGDGWSMIGVLGVVAAVLLAAAWLVLLPTIECSPTVRLVLAVPGVTVFGVAVASAVVARRPTGDGLPNGLFVLVELLVPLTVVVLGVNGVRGVRLLRYTLVLLASTAIGLFHQLADYVAAIMFSSASWDAPPGMGSFGVICILLTALATLVLWRVESARAASRRYGTGQVGFSPS